MLCTIRTSDQTAVEVALLLKTYGISLDDFLRANLQFLEVAMPTISGIADQAERTTKPDFAKDLVGAVLPCLELRAEFRRVCAHIDDAVIRLRAQRLEVEAMRQQRGNPVVSTPSPRRIQGLVNPRTILAEDRQYLGESELELLNLVGKRRGYPLLYAPGPLRNSDPNIGNVLDLNKPGQNIQAARGLEIMRNDIERWLTLLQYYGLAPLGLTIGVTLKSQDGAALRAGFSNLLSQLTQVVCFLFAANQSLGQVYYREDLVAIHERGLRLAAAWQRSILEVEVAIHQANGHSEVMISSLLIIASGAAAGEDIYGEREAVPALREPASTRGLVPDPSEFASIPPIADELS